MNSLLFPNGYKCLCCGSEIVESCFDVCNLCYKNLPFIKGRVCLKCGEPIFSDAQYCMHCKNELPVFTKAFAPFTFDGEITHLIYNLKYNGAKHIAKTLSNFIFKHFVMQNINVDVVIPVPLFISREARRGYNQADLLITAFRENNFNVNNSCLVRNVNTETQTNLTKQQRKSNVENAFKVINKSVVKNKNVLIVDDVYTTGATFNAVAKVLLGAGAKNVYALSVAHTCLEKS